MIIDNSKLWMDDRLSNVFTKLLMKCLSSTPVSDKQLQLFGKGKYIIRVITGDKVYLITPSFARFQNNNLFHSTFIL